MYRKLINRFSRIGLKYFSKYLEPLKEEIVHSDISIVFDFYVGKMFFFSFLAFLGVFIYVLFIFIFLGGFTVFASFISALLMSLISLFGVLTVFHSYPFHLSGVKKKSIEANLPFAINHANAIASSGAPSSVIFRLLMQIPEYGEITNISRKIIRNVDVFGMDTSTAVKEVADRTPSQDLRQFLYGMVSNIETGGDLKKYLQNASKEALFDYELKREKFLSTLSTYADFYTAVLIAAPLFFVSILSIMSLIGGQVMGMDIPTAMRMGIYVLIPLVNVGFIIFINYTQPEI